MYLDDDLRSPPSTQEGGQAAFPRQASSLHLRLQVSLNEEHVTCTIGIGHAQCADLGERGHHYCLLTLVRRRMDDARRGLDASSQGWIGNAALAAMLGLDVSHLNVQVHRLRRQILHALPPGVEPFEVIERRRGEIRFGSLAVSVVRGSVHEGSFWPQRAA